MPCIEDADTDLELFCERLEIDRAKLAELSFDVSVEATATSRRGRWWSERFFRYRWITKADKQSITMRAEIEDATIVAIFLLDGPETWPEVIVFRSVTPFVGSMVLVGEGIVGAEGTKVVVRFTLSIPVLYAENRWKSPPQGNCRSHITLHSALFTANNDLWCC